MSGASLTPIGPVLEYMAACPASEFLRCRSKSRLTRSGGCSGVEAASLNWFKISESGWNGREFASETITRTRSWTFEIPAEVAPG